MKLFLIDGHALIFKMYYAFLGRPMINSKGQDTSILFGFTKYLLEMIDREKPTHVAVSFDPPGGTFRNEMYPPYKANRGETPQLVIDALEPLTSIVEALGIPVLMIKGFEADDVIGSAAKLFASEATDVYMVTPDKDYGQLIAPHIFQYKPGKGGSDAEILGPAEVCAKYNIDEPGQVIDILTLCGDTADNVPGVQGVGPVGAGKLLGKYKSVEEIYNHINELTDKQQAMFREAQGHIALSKALVTIKTDIPLEVSLEDMALKASLPPKILELMDFYEMRSLKRFVNDKVHEKPVGDLFAVELHVNKDFQYQEVPLQDVLQQAAQSKSMAIELTEGGAVVCSEGKCALADLPSIAAIASDTSVTKIGYNLKEVYKKIDIQGPCHDILLEHYLINPERSHAMDALAREYLGIELEDQPQIQEATLFGDTETSTDVQNLAPKRAAAIASIDAKLWEELSKAGVQKLYQEIEEPLEKVLSDMETAGVKIDLASLKEFADSLRVKALEEEAKVREIAGNPMLNVSSPKQIGELIFEQLKLDPKAKKPIKGNWPTDEETLSEIQHPVIDAILEYRGLKKLLSTYIEPFPQYVSPKDGRVHTTFNQALTSTGRLSSSQPNLQNIPVRTEQGREIRKAFSAPQGCVIMSADYSQIELRLMAHFCKDEHMIQAFRDGQDVHSSMAAKIFSKPISDVTPEDRRIAKTANFGIMYGISAFGLAQRLRCPRKEAARIIDDYFASFPAIRSFIDNTLSGARADGYVQTLFGRRRYVRDVTSHNANVRSVAERNAINAPIQGTAADIIKLAMINVYKALKQAGLKSRMVLQIHDELLLEVPVNEISQAREILIREMENVIKLDVPLTVECNYGENWLEAH